MTNEEYKEKVKLALLNPSSMIDISIDSLNEILEGRYEIMNATNPFMFLLEASTANCAAAIQEHHSLLRYAYKEMADEQEGLYRFMADDDYVGRFATPGGAPYVFALRKDEILARAVPVPNTNIRKLVIPRNTRIVVGDVPFGFQYPIEIRVMSHGGLQVVYNVDKPSPLYSLTSNIVDWSVVASPDGEFVLIRPYVYQFALKTHEEVLNSAAAFSKSFDFVDKFYHCRVYISKDSKTWTEIATTHSDQTYDPTKLTATLKVLDGKVRVEIPLIYYSTGMASGNLRVDVYSTKGAIEMELGGYTVNSFQASWYDYDNDDGGIYSSPLSLLTNFAVFSEGTAIGGTDGIDFEALKERVTSTTPDDGIAVSPAQLEVKLADRGYGSVLNVDDMDTRIYLATRALPNPKKNEIVSGANCTIDLFATRIEELVQYDTVVDNGARVTIKPDTLFKYSDGKVLLVKPNELQQLVNASLEARANYVNTRDYLYTPFHYVLDTTQDFFACRGYYFEMPSVLSRNFLSENDTAEIEVATNTVTISKETYGFRLLVVTRSGESYRKLPDNKVRCQLSFLPVGESARAYMDGKLLSKIEDERVWEFKITTNYDVDYLEALTLTSFSMFEDDAGKYNTGLTGLFDIFHITVENRLPTYELSELDNLVNDDLLPLDYMAVTRDQVKLEFGKVLRNLWSNARAVVTEEDYAKYSENVPDYWERNEYETDASGAWVFYPTGPGGELEPKLVHAKGDPKLMPDGTPVWKHQIGEIKYNNGKPIIAKPRAVARHVDLFFLEGSLMFVTDKRDVEYRTSLAKSLINFLELDIAQVSKGLLPGTELYFYPKRTLGRTKAIVRDGVVEEIEASTSWRVTFHLPPTQYSNEPFRETLKSTARNVIANALSASSTSISEIISEIRTRMGEDAVPVDIAPLGVKKDLTAFTMYDESFRCGVRHVLVVLPDETIRLEDDIVFEWGRTGVA